MVTRAILITGCSSGIGLASARVFKARGWRVLATARRPEDRARLERELGVEALALELTEPASIEACAQGALERTGGRLYGLFNNAAFGQVGAVEDLTPDLLRRQLEVNLIGTHDLTRRVLPAMRRHGAGRIVMCSSVLGLAAVPLRGAYCASKFALEALTDSLRIELKGTGIAVSLIEPGPIRSRFVESALANFVATVDIEGSPHRETYRARLEAMKGGGASFFKLEPEAVAAKLVHALESQRPRRRYYVTVPTYLAAAGKCLLPGPLADWLVAKM